MAVIVKAMYKKYGRESIDVLNDAFFEFGKAEGEKYKKLAGYEGREDEIDVQVALQDIYPQVHMHAGAAGLVLERIHFEPEESISHCHQCPMFEGWKDVWDEPWFMCEFISYHHDRGFMAGLNPKLEWTEHAEKDDIVVTGDFPLAARCLDNEARVLGHRGRPFTEENIGDALASRHLLRMLREQGEMKGGPPPFSNKDRSQFLQGLDQVINAIKRDN